MLNKQSLTADKGCSSSLGVGRGADNYTVKTDFVANYEHVPRTRTATLVRPKQWKRT